MPIYQMASNFGPCNLRDNNSAYIYSKATVEEIPAGSVIVSKLVYPLIDYYFSRVEHVISAEKLSLYDPALITRNPTGVAGYGASFSSRNTRMLEDINGFMEQRRNVYLAGDVVDEDKSPEKLLLSDLDFKIWQPKLPIKEMQLTFPRELFLYSVTGLRKGSPVERPPEKIERGLANDGTFANGIRLLGFRPNGPVTGIGREAINFDFFWQTSSPISSKNLYAGLIFMDNRMNRIGPPCWHTVGGTYGAAEWETGRVIRESVNVYPQPLPPGTYFIALGLVDAAGVETKYIPAGPNLEGREFDFVLLMQFSNRPQPADAPSQRGAGDARPVF
jgi:hypothetical protein